MPMIVKDRICIFCPDNCRFKKLNLETVDADNRMIGGVVICEHEDACRMWTEEEQTSAKNRMTIYGYSDEQSTGFEELKIDIPSMMDGYRAALLLINLREKIDEEIARIEKMENAAKGIKWRI